MYLQMNGFDGDPYPLLTDKRLEAPGEACAYLVPVESDFPLRVLGLSPTIAVRCSRFCGAPPKMKIR